MYICMYLCVYVFMYVCMYVCRYLCIYIYIYAFMYSNIRGSDKIWVWYLGDGNVRANVHIMFRYFE